jgi:formylglycine-generating enzyme required for sulfatase activity
LLIISLASCQSSTPTISAPTPATAAATATHTPVASTATKAVEATPLSIETTVREADGMIMAHIQAGEFSMGSNDGEADEAPVHAVSLDSFWMDTTEITNRMYSLCVEAGGCAAITVSSPGVMIGMWISGSD